MFKTVYRGLPEKKSNDFVYTEDGIPVRRLYVKLLSFRTQRPNSRKPFDKTHLKSIFSKFGEVEDITVYTKVNYSFAFVTMSKYADAAKIINQKLLKSLGYRVTKADSWHQPPIQAKPTDEDRSALDSLKLQEKVIAEESEKQATLEGNSILKLNDDCLFSIFDFLNVLDLIRIEATCPRIKALVQSLYKHKYQNVDFEHIKGTYEPLTLMEARSILMQIGRFIKDFKIQSKNIKNENTRILLMIPRYCSNLKYLEIFGYPLTTRLIEPFIGTFNDLTSLSLVNTKLEDSLFTRIFNAQDSKLKSLNVSQNYSLRGSFLSKFHNLESINLENCLQIQSRHLINFCQRNGSTLTTLNINRCDQLTTECFENIVQHLPKLESLVISNYYQKLKSPNHKIFANIQNLKKLQIVFVNYAKNTELLSALTEANRLEHFDINNAHLTKDEVKILYEFTQLKYLDVSRIQVIDDKAIKMFAERNKQLHTLNICDCCCVTEDGLVQFIEFGKHCELIDITHNFGITNSVIPLAVAALNKGCGYSDNKKLKMIVGKTQITQDVLLADFMKNQNKLQLSFDYKPNPTQNHLLPSARGFLDLGSDFEDDMDSGDEDDDDDYEDDDSFDDDELYNYQNFLHVEHSDFDDDDDDFLWNYLYFH